MASSRTSIFAKYPPNAKKNSRDNLEIEAFWFTFSYLVYLNIIVVVSNYLINFQ